MSTYRHQLPLIPEEPTPTDTLAVALIMSEAVRVLTHMTQEPNVALATPRDADRVLAEVHTTIDRTQQLLYQVARWLKVEARAGRVRRAGWDGDISDAEVQAAELAERLDGVVRLLVGAGHALGRARAVSGRLVPLVDQDQDQGDDERV